MFFLFMYKPMVGLLMAFENYNFKKGIFGSEWVGLANFKRFFRYKNCWRLIRNTLLLNVFNMLWTTPINIIFALMINEFREKGVFRKSATTIAYLPHFLSGVVVISIFNQFLMPSGTINQIIEKLGGTPLKFLSDPKYFRTIYNFICIWQETGWGSVIYVAALAGIDSSLYEAARMDGANKLQQIWHVSLPGIASTISIQFIMNLGYLLSGGTDRVMLLYNEKLYPTADIIGTYIYRVGLLNTDYGYSVAVGLFQSLIGLVLVLITNKHRIHKKVESDKVFCAIVLTLFCLMIIFPFLNVLSISLSSRLPVSQGRVWLWPVGFNLESYKRAFAYDGFLRSYWNTIRYTLMDTVLSLAITMLTAYPLSKSYLRGRKFFNVFFVFTMLFSGGLIASYINMTKMGLNGTIWAVLFPAACSPYTIILMRTFFEQIPTSMEESAFIDGANDFHVFTKITIPLSKPIISTVVLLFAVNRWNSWFNEFIYLTDKKLYPLQLVIRSIVLTGESEGALQAGEVVLGQSLKYAVIILAMIPMLILYPLIQKYLVKGIMLGAVKG